ncbi:MAG TPA: Uma2 family endonuclease [Vicinamibacterales bacterium]|nr:Uma2 family endonuclease [Vicinamibacterales bacterium]
MSVAVSRRRFTVDDYERMDRAGIFLTGGRVELIDGEIVTKMTTGPRHHASVDRATRAFVMKAGESAIVRVQGAVVLNLFNAPGPDLVLLRPRPDFYASRQAAPADILLIVEVSDSSIDYDRDVKASLYARSSVPEYWVVDLNENVLLRYSSPRGGTYQSLQRHQRGQLLAPLLLPECVVSADDLIPV